MSASSPAELGPVQTRSESMSAYCPDGKGILSRHARSVVSRNFRNYPPLLVDAVVGTCVFPRRQVGKPFWVEMMSDVCNLV